MMNKPISRRSFLKMTGLTIAVSVTPFGYSVMNASAQKEGVLSNPMYGLR